MPIPNRNRNRTRRQTDSCTACSVQWRTVPFRSDGILSPNFAGATTMIFSTLLASQAAFAARQSGVERGLLDCIYGTIAEHPRNFFTAHVYRGANLEMQKNVFFALGISGTMTNPCLVVPSFLYSLHLQLPAATLGAGSRGKRALRRSNCRYRYTSIYIESSWRSMWTCM